MIKLIRYHLPTIVKRENDFGISKITWQIYKSFGNWKDPPPPLGKIPKKSRFFYDVPKYVGSNEADGNVDGENRCVTKVTLTLIANLVKDATVTTAMTMMMTKMTKMIFQDEQRMLLIFASCYLVAMTSVCTNPIMCNLIFIVITIVIIVINTVVVIVVVVIVVVVKIVIILILITTFSKVPLLIEFEQSWPAGTKKIIGAETSFYKISKYHARFLFTSDQEQISWFSQ